jgi:hypothetical protein
MAKRESHQMRKQLISATINEWLQHSLKMTATENLILNPVGIFPRSGGPTVQWHYAGTQRSYGVQLNPLVNVKTL